MSKITVTKEMVEENMKDVLCSTAIEFDKPVTYVTVRMKNGFTLRESTTCVDPVNYNEEIGKKICLEKIEDKVWFLLGYQVQDQMHYAEVNQNKLGEGITFREALKALYEGCKVALPEWKGYWFVEDGLIKVFTKDHEFTDTPWIDKYCHRNDWIILNFK